MLSIANADGTFTLMGGRSDELIGYAGPVCVTGALSDPVPQFGRVITVKTYRLLGDGKHAPIVGTMRKIGASYYIETAQRRRLRVVANDNTTLASTVNHLVWLTATWSDGALHLIRIGPLGR